MLEVEFANSARVEVRIDAEHDVMAASRQARLLAERLGFSRSSAYQVATAASELAANLLLHAGGGRLLVNPLPAPDAGGLLPGLELCAEDDGPGIADLALALTDGYSTRQGLGCGLPGVKRLMDEFAIDSAPGRGTRVRAVKWR